MGVKGQLLNAPMDRVFSGPPLHQMFNKLEGERITIQEKEQMLSPKTKLH